MKELERHEFERALPLFEGFDYSLSIHAAVEGNNPGRIFVDDVREPRTALALTVEGYLLAGESDNPATNEALRRLLKERIFSGEVFVNGDWSMSLAVDPGAWEARLPELIPTHEVEELDRYHYLCRQVRFDWRDKVTEEYTVQRIDQALLADAEVVFPDAWREWIDLEEMWWTTENFLAKGVAFCVVHGGEAVSWCVSDCVAGDRIDMGVYTLPAYRRRGLAAVTVAATVDYCLSHGFSAVGWHCNADNVGSWKTAERAGFERKREYVYYYYVYDPVDHLAELGWYHYKRGEYARTVQYYEQVFAQRDDNPDYYYHLTAVTWATLGDTERALKYLRAAADRGWAHADYTRQVEAFGVLHGRPEWEAVLARMEQNG